MLEPSTNIHLKQISTQFHSRQGDLLQICLLEWLSDFNWSCDCTVNSEVNWTMQRSVVMTNIWVALEYKLKTLVLEIIVALKRCVWFGRGSWQWSQLSFLLALIFFLNEVDEKPYYITIKKNCFSEIFRIFKTIYYYTMTVLIANQSKFSTTTILLYRITKQINLNHFPFSRTSSKDDLPSKY